MDLSTMGLLNNSDSEPVEAPEKWTHINERECSKKHALV